MARGMRNLAALAAIGALGYKFAKDRDKKHDPNAVIVEDRSTRSADARRQAAAAEPAAQSQTATVAAPTLTTASSGSRITDAIREAAAAEGAKVSAGELAGQSGPAIKPVDAKAPVAAGGYRPRPAFVNDNTQRNANAAADAMFENRASAAAAPRRSSDDQKSVFDPGQDIGPNISGLVARNTGVNLNNPADAGRSSGVGGATAEDMEREQEYRRMRRKAQDLSSSGIPFKDQTNQSARIYRMTNTRPSTIQGGRGTATGMKAGDIEAWKRQQEDLKKRGRGYNTTRLAKGGEVKAKAKKMSSGGGISASKRADGIAVRGKTKCKIY